MIVENQKLTACGLWRTLRYDLERANDRARYIAREKFAWPGGYALFAVTDDCACLCAACCRAEYRQIARSESRDGWYVAEIGNTCDCDEPVTCDHCGNTIE